jgi:large subunit ribosomal protein L35
MLAIVCDSTPRGDAGRVASIPAAGVAAHLVGTSGRGRARARRAGASLDAETMPSIKMKTHKGVKKRFKVSATGKVSHKPCGSSHLNSHKSGKKIRRLRRRKFLKGPAVEARLRAALLVRKPKPPELPAQDETAGAEPTAG